MSHIVRGGVGDQGVGAHRRRCRQRPGCKGWLSYREGRRAMTGEEVKRYGRALTGRLYSRRTGRARGAGGSSTPPERAGRTTVIPPLGMGSDPSHI